MSAITSAVANHSTGHGASDVWTRTGSVGRPAASRRIATYATQSDGRISMHSPTKTAVQPTARHRRSIRNTTTNAPGRVRVTIANARPKPATRSLRAPNASSSPARVNRFTWPIHSEPHMYTNENATMGARAIRVSRDTTRIAAPTATTLATVHRMNVVATWTPLNGARTWATNGGERKTWY